MMNECPALTYVHRRPDPIIAEDRRHRNAVHSGMNLGSRQRKRGNQLDLVFFTNRHRSVLLRFDCSRSNSSVVRTAPPRGLWAGMRSDELGSDSCGSGVWLAGGKSRQISVARGSWEEGSGPVCGISTWQPSGVAVYLLMEAAGAVISAFMSRKSSEELIGGVHITPCIEDITRSKQSTLRAHESAPMICKFNPMSLRPSVLIYAEQRLHSKSHVVDSRCVESRTNTILIYFERMKDLTPCALLRLILPLIRPTVE
ncbi:unnamed protein product [Periconia digitata]|uniref:Uncharacterized protein n=1 Tax=Periconia digitata TaxID=1303443 RepID=A0A9W4UUT3_9PLEO|nr:unnamed protein product [Periconia digitata]